MRKSFFVFIFALLALAIGMVLALQAFPLGQTDLRIAGCSGEDNSSTSNNYATACNGIYPQVCGAGADLLSCNDGNSEIHRTNANNQYSGIRISAYNSTVSNCISVSQVFLCHEWWSSNAPITCTIDVDADNGTSFKTINTTCPQTGANPGVACQNVTANETWVCNSFFGSSGNKAFARMQTRAAGPSVRTTTWDALFFNVTYTANNAPVINNITASHTIIKGGNTLTIYANTSIHGVNDSDGDTLYLYCDNSTAPNSTNTDCKEGTLFDSTYPYDLTCGFPTNQTNMNYTEYCRVYDGYSYSSTIPNITYTTDSSPPITSIISVAGDTVAPYFDTANDGRTNITISGEANMLCRWSSSNDVYSSMSNDCVVWGIYANCSVSDISLQGEYTRYFSCKDSLGNEQNTSQNSNAHFYLDYTAPTTTSNANTDIHAPNYTVAITEADNLDGDPLTYTCTSPSQGCSPILTGDIGGVITIVYTSSNRGANYLRFYSVDFAGNTQVVVNQTININRLPVLASASDNAVIIKGGAAVNVSSVAYDLDSQQMSFYVCNSSGATVSGCSGTEYCSSSGTANMSCTFGAENDSASHTWYSYIFDSAGEAAANNPLTGNYTTDSQAPAIILANPLNNSNITQNSVTITTVVNKALTNSWYSLDSGVNNVSMSNVSLYLYTHSNTSIANGNYALSLWANDSYGNIGSLSGNSFTINATVVSDTTAPAIIILSPLNASYNLLSPLLNITADEALNWAGYKLNGGALTTLSNSSTTNWYAALTLSQESTNNLTIYANDTSNNQNNKSIIFYADSSSPRYSNALASPSVANVSQNVNCSISWTDGFNIANVKISENSLGSHENHTIIFSGTSGIASYLILGAKLTTPGTYQCIFYAEDTAGNSNSTNVSFDVRDVTAPSVTIISPSNLTYNTDNVSVSILTSKTASSAWYSLDNAANTTMSNTSSVSWNSSLISLSEGSHNITFYANDSSNNIGNSSRIYFSVRFTAGDTIPPVITVNTISNASYKTSTAIGLNITTNENTKWAGYILNGGILINMSNSSSLNWNATLSDLGAESTNNLIVYANDTSNNQGNNTITFYVDIMAPRFLDAAANPSAANETQNVICNAYINDSFALSSVKISENATTPGIFMNHTIEIYSAGWANYTITNVQKGGYSCIFYARDSALNSNSTSVSFAVNDVAPPVISINSPLNQSYSTNSILLSITSNENLSSANYSLDNGITNISLAGSGKIWSKTVSFTEGSKTLTFYGFDISKNLGTASVSFLVDTSVNDVTPPAITIWSPVNNSYYTSADILLNITSDESLSWAGFINNSGALTNLNSFSTTNWNSTITLAEGQHNITFYANDSSTNHNQANKSILIYVDLTNPQVSSFTCTSPVNDSQDVNCSAVVSDSIGLSYAIIRYNATGSWQNSSQISLSGLTGSLSYIISAGNTAPGNFNAEIYLYDLSGRSNLTKSYTINVNDDSYPEIYNITYFPNTTAELDPYVRVDVNATVVEDYKINKVELMWRNLSDENWISVAMTNNSAIANGSSATVIYNASFLPGNGTYAFKINATDLAGNMNVSSNYTLVVANDTSQSITTNIPSIKSFTYAQRTENNSLGWLNLNNSGDISLNFTIRLTSSLGARLSINYTGNQTASYSASSGQAVNITIDVNTTGLTTALYNYNVTVASDAGTAIYEKQIYIQTAEGPYLTLSITKYSSSVTKGQTDIELVASVANLGTQDATGVYLNWTLPSEFTITSGSASRNIGNLPIGSSGTNTIKVSVSSSAADQVVNITATATAGNADSANDSKTATIGSPITETVITTVTAPSGGGGGGGAGGAGGAAGEAIVYSKTIEIVRGKEDSFDMEVYNKYTNSSLEDLTLNISGFLSQYISVSPNKIEKINSRETKKFSIKLKIPSYKENYEEHTLKIIIKGYKVDGKTRASYTETYNIKLIIQEVSGAETNLSLSEAEKAILEMKNAGFNIDEASKLMEQAKNKLSESRNKEAQVLSQQIISIKNKAFEADSIIKRILEALKDPRKTNLLTGNVAKEIIDENGEKVSINSVLFGRAIFSGQSAEDVLNMAIAAFNRGDYSTAEERAKSAQVLLLLERKGNFWLFLYLYWHFILIGFLIFLVIGVLSYKTYKKSSITKGIQNIDKEEDNIRNLIISAQKNYFSGKISAGEYHKITSQHHSKLAKIKQERLNLRNKRVKMLKKQQILQDLGAERLQVESEIKKLQEQFYKDKKISENEYKPEFRILNERLAEIEGEKITLELLKEKKNVKNQKNDAPPRLESRGLFGARFLDARERPRLESRGFQRSRHKDIKEELKESAIESEKEMQDRGMARIILLKLAGFIKSPFHHISKMKENKRLKEEAKIKDKIKHMLK